MTTAYPVQDSTGTVRTLFGGEADVTLGYHNGTGFDLGNLTFEFDDKLIRSVALVGEGPVAAGTDRMLSVEAIEGAFGTTEVVVKNGGNVVARYTVFVVPRIAVTVEENRETTSEYVNAFTNELSELKVEKVGGGGGWNVATSWWNVASVPADKTGTLTVGGLKVGEETFVLKSGDMVIGYLDVKVGLYVPVADIEVETGATADAAFTTRTSRCLRT